MKKSLTVIVPAYNEEGNLRGTIESIVPLLEREFGDYEILIFNDFSADQTGKIADELASGNKKIKVIHNPRNMGLGFNYKKGVEMASKDYVIMIPGDNEITNESFEIMFKNLGAKDIVIPHTVNTEIRPLGRQALSKGFTTLMNLISGLNIKYYNGTVIHKRSIIQSIGIETDSFAYQSEALIKLIKSGKTYIETPMYLKERGYGKSKALRLKNVVRVLKSMGKIFYEVRIKGGPARP
jgi:dolichol-phosphate mannosyltransferase